MKFEELKERTIYCNKDGTELLLFEGIRNDNLATFTECKYDERRGGNILPTENKRYLTKKEVEKLL